MANHIVERVVFSSSIYVTKIENSSVCVPHIQQIKSENPASANYSNKGGWHSPLFTYDSHDFLKPICNQIQESLRLIYDKVGVNGNAECVAYWFNVSNKYNYTATHRHGNCFYSAVLFVKTPQKCGNLVFERADSADNWISYSKFESPENWAAYWIEPAVDKCIIFPSYLPHYAEQNMTDNEDDERISIAFNFK